MTNFTVVQSLLVNFCVLLILGCSFSSGQTTTWKNVICSYHSVSPLFSGVTSFTTSDIDPSICTHLEYNVIDAYNGSLLVSSRGIDHSKGLQEFQNLSLSNPSLNVLLGVVDGSYPQTVSKPYEDRQILINNIIDFLRTWDFDGVDLRFLIITAEVVTFVEEMHAACLSEAKSSGKEPLILMLSVSGWGGIGEGVDLQSLGQAIDILHATPYSQRVVSSTYTTFLSPMYGNGGMYGNVSASVTDFLEAGIPSEKLHIGIKLLATTFRLLDSENTGVGSPAIRSAERGEYTKQTDYVAYYEVCQRLQEEGYTAEFDPEGQVNFAYKGDQWMTYEDPASLEIKMDYVYDHNLGGVVLWYLHHDDYTGRFCDQGPYPLVSTLYRLASRTMTTTTTPPASTAQPTTTAQPETTAHPQTCSSGIVYKYLPDPYSCEHYRICVFGMLFRYECLPGLSFDSEKGYCVKNPTTTCVTIPEPSK